MKILAIRGSNLASLAGEFEIDLSHAPLADTGVFAIVGNTGAGKSTLLDALCVALFDRTPRLTNHSRVVVGRGDDDPTTLGAHDARTLLRRGAGAGFAEVDFESGDARRYRARWSVRRARNHSHGNLQDQTMSLTALDSDERLGGTKTETLRAIAARIGLSFDQFRRSALLAQGEFAALLRADGKDRSELLERMTGTQIYSRLSIAAHVRAAVAEQRLRDTRAAALAIPVLADAARIEAESEHALAEAARGAARARLVVAEAAARWLAGDAERRAAVATAEGERDAAIAAHADAEPARTELATRRRLETIRAPLELAARSVRELAAARGDLERLEAAVRVARDDHAALAVRLAAIDELHVPIRAGRIAAAMPEPSPAAGEIDREALQRARDALPDAAWLAARATLAPEIAAWPWLDERFEEHASIVAALATLERALGDRETSRLDTTATRAMIAADHDAKLAELAQAERAAQAFHDRRGPTLDAARKAEDEARVKLGEAERLIAIASGARALAAERATLVARIAELDAADTTDRTRGTTVAANREREIVLRDERTRALDELRRAAGYEHARTELCDGEPCPLCGALEHPWRDRGALDDVIASAVAHLDATVTRLAELDRETAAIALAAERRSRDRETADERLAAITDAATAATSNWRAHLAAAGELVLDDDPSSAAAETLAAERVHVATRRLEAARDARHRTEASTKAASEAQATARLVRADVDQHAARLAAIDRSLAEIEADGQRLRGERTGRTERAASLAPQIATAIARWNAIEEATSTTAELASGVGTPDGRVSGMNASDSLVASRTAIAARVEHWRRSANRVAAAEARLAGLRLAIAGDADEAERRAAEHATRIAEVRKREEELARAADEAAARLRAAAAGAGIDLAELGEPHDREAALDLAALVRAADRLAGDRDAQGELEARLTALDAAVVRMRAVVEERLRAVTEHAETRPDDPALADARALDAIAAAVADAEAHAARTAATLAADTDARSRREAAFAGLADDEARAEVDRVLGSAIGSHDGKLFRSFAQSLTLDALLAVANAHLLELAPRYQLERIPRHDLEIQVIDRDLGDEVRSIHSLSGGEAFLVSLALALGLSSLSAHDVRVRTLLIDEGFGTLDPSTLDTALAVLDALQATGRQIGVISHVPALIERVGAHVSVVQRGGGRSEVVVRT